MTPGRRVLIGIAVGATAVALGWALMASLARVLRSSEPPPTVETPAQPQTPPQAAAVPRIKATLFFASEDGHALVPVEQEIPLAEGTVGQARALVEAQLTATPPRRSSQRFQQAPSCGRCLCPSATKPSSTSTRRCATSIQGGR